MKRLFTSALLIDLSNIADDLDFVVADVLLLTVNCYFVVVMA